MPAGSPGATTASGGLRLALVEGQCEASVGGGDGEGYEQPGLDDARDTDLAS